MTASSPPAWTTGVRREVLPNGLTVLVQRDRSAPVAAVVTHVKAGFFDEPDEWAGISHVLEHMFFKGTPTRGVGQIAKETKAAGGYLNASTTYDHTSYFAVLPAARLREAVTIQADALMHASVNADELGRELQVIIQEAKRKLDHPGAVTHETLHEVMYDRHRIRRWRIGYEKVLAGFTRADVFGYYQSRYVPSRTIVSIVGDVEEESALALARETYGPWAAAPGAVNPSPAEPPRRTVRVRTLRGDVTQAELALGWRGVPALDPRASALDLAAGVLGAGRGSWLYRALRESGLATSVSVHHYSPTELGVFSIGVTCEADRVGPVIDRIAEATARLVLVGPSPEDFERARTLLLTRWSRGMEEMEGRASSLAAAEALEGYAFLDREFAALAAVTAEEVREAARQVLDPESVSAVAYLPRTAGTDLTVDGLAGAFAVTSIAPAPIPGTAAAAIHTPRNAPGRMEQGVLHVALPAFDLLLRHKPGVPTVSLGAYFPRHDFDPVGKAGLGALTVRASLRGAAGLDAAGLAFASERLGGTLGGSVGLDWTGLGGTMLSSRLAAAASLLDAVLHAPSFEQAQVEAERQLLVEETRQVADDMFRFPFQLAMAGAFGEAGYGVPALGLPADLAALTVDDVRRWHAERLVAGRGVIVAVGDLDPEQAAAVLAGTFGRHSLRAAHPLDAPGSWSLTAGPQQRVVARQKAQTAFAMVFPGPSRRDPARFAVEVWAAIASGLGGRLFEALRDRRSLAYTVMASSWQKARAGALLSYIATSPEREDEARREMLKELLRFADEAVTPVELSQATNYLVGQTAVQRQSGSAVAAEILEAWLAGGGLADLADSEARYRAVTAEAVRAVAERILGGRSGTSETVVRAEGVIRGEGGGK